MSIQTLSVGIRTEFKKKGIKSIRSKGLVPGNVIGSGIDSTSVQLDVRDLERVFRQNDSGINTILDLQFDDSKEKSEKVITYNLDLDPTTHQIIHVEFLRVKGREIVEVTCPVRSVSKAKGEVMGGLILQSMRRVKIEAHPDRIPTEIVVDIKDLALGESYKIKDLQFPEGVRCVNDPHNKVISVMKQRSGDLEEVEVTGADSTDGVDALAAEGAAAEET